MDRLESPVPYGTAVSADDTHTLRYVLSLPQAVEDVWNAVATQEGLPGWLAAADPFVRREGGAITLRWQNTDEHGTATVAPGQVTGWGPTRLAEYTVAVHGRIRFELQPAAGPGASGTRLRFTNEINGSPSCRLDCLAGWHHHFEFLLDALAGRRKDWSAWNLDRWRELRADYARAGVSAGAG
ncbi:SRPBCC domain-containing protein [Streptomyces sp. NPDC052496]|uniref:SRPBCC domain-containing protein n=1 Tax=Streptomyces sp. NPDC052496 TaxID=3154951 RepID=UPI00341BCB4B